MPERRHSAAEDGAAPSVRSFWSGTITFGLVSIPVDLVAAVRPRQKSMKLVDSKGHALGRRYHCSKDAQQLADEDIVRGYETESGKTVVITDEEFESAAPEMSRDIELRRFAPLEQIPALYFDRPYFLAPAGRSAKAYTLLAQTMERTGRVGIGAFVMRGHEYLAAIIAEHGVLRVETLRHADEIRTPQQLELPQRRKPAKAKVDQFIKAIDALTHAELNMAELEDREAEALQELAASKQHAGRDVIEQAGLEEEDPEAAGAQVVDLMALLRKSLAKSAVVTTAREQAPKAPVTNIAERRKAKIGGRPAPRTRQPEQLANSSKSELLKIAARLQIPGRSKMDRSALLKAIRRAN